MTKKEALQEISRKYDEIHDCYFYDYIEDDVDEYQDFDDLLEGLEDADFFAQAGEVIYYSKAIEYLAEEDVSLTESLELAEEMGFRVQDLNSELLASLLKQRIIRDGMYDFQDEINEAFKIDDCECDYCGDEIEDGDFCSKDCALAYDSDIT